MSDLHLDRYEKKILKALHPAWQLSIHELALAAQCHWKTAQKRVLGLYQKGFICKANKDRWKLHWK